MADRLPIDWDEALRLHREGWTFADIAREFDYAYKTIRIKLRAMGARPRRPSRRRSTKRGRKLVEVWRLMREKCSVPSHRSYGAYGAQGVQVCREWDDSFDAFHDWAVANGFRIGLRLARRNRSRGYSPANCRWITPQEKLTRRHGQRPPSWTLTAFGETKGPAAWTRDPRCKVTATTLLQRVRRGMSGEEAITMPPDPTRKPGAKSPPPRPSGKRIDVEEAKRLYLEEGLSLPEVASHVEASYTGVLAAFRRLGVRRDDPPAPTSTPEGSRLHKTWLSIHRRCSDPSDSLHAYHGALGICVCAEWEQFRPFLEWAQRTGARRGLCLARRNLERDYSPANCEWVERAELLTRRRPPTRLAPPRRPITAFGEVKGLVAWSKDARCSVSTTTISRRLRLGWPVENAIADPAESVGASGAIFTELKAFGMTKSMTEWSRDRRCKVSLHGIADRLRRGWSAEDAIATLPFRQPKSR